MATAPVIIPGALVKLAEGVTVDATSTTAQAVFTVPNGTKCLVHYLVFRDSSTTTSNASTTVGAGFDTSANTVVTAGAGAASITSGPHYRLQAPNVTPVTYGTSGTVFYVLFGGTLTSNGTLKCDVYGTLDV